MNRRGSDKMQVSKEQLNQTTALKMKPHTAPFPGAPRALPCSLLLET